MKKEKVLVIDDERPTLRMFTLLLSAYGYDIITAENGRDGVEAFERESPGLVLTDIKMPVMDGIEVLKAIKRINPQTEVIVITGHGDMDLAIQALNLDATDFINKPLRRHDLEQALRRASQRLAIAKNEEGQVRLEERGKTAVINVRGNVSTHSIPHLAEALERASNLGHRVLLLDFDENASINGAGLTGLKELLEKQREHGRRVILAGLTDNFRAVFESMGITRIAEIFDNRDDALAAH
ncbi:response regulator [Pseudodesulfovibrio sp.]|uniref:response regulator n=1 Tax=Pseudodesulfovibrio sp. TaxID=2035812 RepID=UPI0026231755|nr:response regulator [Pseudodesulfovibrio sp.]MDD3311623.1 response regulator [Pseudodesulfovibrio sp.]